MSAGLLAVHVVAGALGLLLGPVTMLWPRRVPGTGRGLLTAYLIAVSVVNLTALGLVAREPGSLWWLAPLAVGTQVAVSFGWWLDRSAAPGRSGRRIRLLGGSYVALVTALLVVSWGGVLAWVLPTVVGVAVLEMAAAKAERRGRAGNAEPG